MADTARHAAYSRSGTRRGRGCCSASRCARCCRSAVGVLVATVGLMTGLVAVGRGRPGGAGWWRRSGAGAGPRSTNSRCPAPRSGLAQGRATWTPASLLAAGPGFEPTGRGSCAAWSWWRRRGRGRPGRSAVVRDRPFQTVSATITAAATGFPMRSLREQDAMLAALGRGAGPVRPAAQPGVADHLAGVVAPQGCRPPPRAGRRAAGASRRAASGSGRRWPTTTPCWTCRHRSRSPTRSTITLTVELRRVRRRRQTQPVRRRPGRVGRGARAVRPAAATTADLAPSRAAVARRAGGLDPDAVDPTRGRPGRLGRLRQSLATATGRAGIEWGPMAVESTWSTCRVDDALHRTLSDDVAAVAAGAGELARQPAHRHGHDAHRDGGVRADPVEQGGGGGQPGADLDRVVERGQDPPRVPGHRPGAAPPGRRRGPRAELARGHPEFRHAGLVTVTAAERRRPSTTPAPRWRTRRASR